MRLLPVLLAMAHASDAHASDRFRSKWRAEQNRFVADAALDQQALGSPLPAHCKFGVVGAGWGGAYVAWRLAIDTSTISADHVCVFEANGRVGGRVYSLHQLPFADDMALDAGAYRFIENDELPAQLVWQALKLPTACYDWKCSGQCEGGHECYVVKDAYGNNLGYSWPIEVMLGQLEDAGAGTQVHFGQQLVSIEPAPRVGSNRSVALTFAGGKTVTVDKLLLNLPGPAITSLKGVLSADVDARTQTLLKSVTAGGNNKVYAYYDDAWWNSRLGHMEGNINDKSQPAPLSGRYHDGPQKCVVGHDPDGQPIYSGEKVRYGNCSGFLEVYYSFEVAYYKQYMSDPLEPVSVLTADVAGGAAAIRDVHASLLAFHAAELKAAGIAPHSLAPPKLVVISNWTPDGKITPGIGYMDAGAYYPSRAKVRAPAPDYDIYVADQDYGYRTGWAVGSLIMAEKVLQAELGLRKPSWMSHSWYEDNIVEIRGEANTTVDCHATINSDFRYMASTVCGAA